MSLFINVRKTRLTSLQNTYTPLICIRCKATKNEGKTDDNANKNNEDKIRDVSQTKTRFRRLDIVGADTVSMRYSTRRSFSKDFGRRRANASMFKWEKWTSRWPTANSFNPIVPLPLRQGFVKNAEENSGVIPDSYANTELMKIPNFLHLTPGHIKTQCKAIKPFCTKWPSGLTNDEILRKHYPVEVITRDYVMSSPSIRDERARKVAIRIPEKELDMDDRTSEKMHLIAGKSRFEKDEATGIDYVVLESDRCPTRQQNYDFLMYTLTVLTAESKKYHEWESEKREVDRLKFAWEGSASQETITNLLKSMKIGANVQSTPSDKTTPDSDLDAIPAVKQYAQAVSNLINKGETESELEEYKKSVESLLGLKSVKS